MSPFEPDGVYASIPYRVLPDRSIEAMMPEGLVKFKTIEQLIASTAEIPAAGKRAHSSDRLHAFDASKASERSKNLPASSQPLDYYSILSNAIKKTEQNSAQLRALVYEWARFNLKRDILYGHPSMPLADLVLQVQEFELAIARIEATSVDTEAKIRSQEDERVQVDQRPAEVLDPPYPPSSVVEVKSQVPLAPLYIGPGQQIENFRYDRRLDGIVPRVGIANQLIVVLILGIMFIGTVIVAGALWHSPVATPQIETKIIMPKPVEPAENIPKVSFPLPTSYGIYALSDNKLTELEPLPISVPDSRVALSAAMTKPAKTTISDSAPAFILFRRDLLNNAPQKITLRMVARMKQETKFVGGKATVTKFEGAWRIRNISRELRISPVPGQREMIIARLDANETLAAGRYALVLNRVGYDFVLNGPVQSPESCLEGFETASGLIFTQCHQMNSSKTN